MSKKSPIDQYQERGLIILPRDGSWTDKDFNDPRENVRCLAMHPRLLCDMEVYSGRFRYRLTDAGVRERNKFRYFPPVGLIRAVFAVAMRRMRSVS